MSSLGADQTARLRAAKLRALIDGATERSSQGEAADFPSGAALRAADGAWVLDDGPTERSLGPALVWALRHDAGRLDLVVDTDAATAGALARRAGYFSLPVTIWRIDGTTMAAVTPDDVEQDPGWDVSSAATLIALMSSSGLEIVEEDGIVKGEYLGLEVARVINTEPDPTLEVGIGRFDREIASMMHAGEPTSRSLERAVGLVSRHRYRGAPPHPLRDLMVARWIRTEVIADPTIVGAVSLSAVATTVAVTNLKDPWPAAAVGTLDGGTDAVVVCSAGSDLDLVPVAADTRAALRPGAELLLAVPERNLPPTLRRVADLLIEPARFVTVETPF